MRVYDTIELIFVTLLILLVGPALIFAGIGYGFVILCYLVWALPYILGALVIWFLVARLKSIFNISKELPTGAREVKGPRKPMFTFKYKGQNIPAGILALSIGMTVIFLPLLIVALFIIIPWQVGVLLFSAMIIIGARKK